MPLLFADSITPEPVSWLWPGYLPFGKVAVLDGDPGLGKSTILIDLAARLSTGRELPNGRVHEPCGSLLYMGEDGAADTIVPRLHNAGADLGRVAIRTTYTNDENGQEEWPAFPDDLPRLQADIEAAGARLVVLDPIMSYLAPDINSNNDQQVRRALMPLAALATETGAAIVLLRHLNKSAGGNTLYRGGGSIGFVGVARAGLVVAHDPDDPTRMVLALNKSNLGPPAPSLFYRLVSCENGAARVEWEGHSTHTPATLLAQADDEQRGALAEASAFLRTALADGPALGTEVQRDAREFGIAPITLRRAREALGVLVKKEQQRGGRYLWSLPGGEVAHTKGREQPEQREQGEQGNNLKNNKHLHIESQDVDLVHLAQDVHVAHPVRMNNLDVPLAEDTKTYSCSACGKSCFVARDRPILCTACKAAARGWSRATAD